MAQTKNQQRAAQAVAARMAHLEWNNAQLVTATRADPGTIGDFLNGKRWPKIGTQGKIERAIGWKPGTLAAIAAGGPDPDPDFDVGAASEDPEITEDELLYRRPEGLTDAEWERIREQARGFIEWQIDKAARER